MSLIYNYTIHNGGDFSIGNDEGAEITYSTTQYDGGFSLSTTFSEEDFSFSDGITNHSVIEIPINNFTIDVLTTHFYNEFAANEFKFGTPETVDTNYTTLYFAPLGQTGIYIDEIFSSSCPELGVKVFTYQLIDEVIDNTINFHDVFSSVGERFTLHGFPSSEGLLNIYHPYENALSYNPQYTKKIVFFSDVNLYESGLITGNSLFPYLNLYKDIGGERGYEKLFQTYSINVDSSVKSGDSNFSLREGGISGYIQATVYFRSSLESVEEFDTSTYYNSLAVNIIEINTLSSGDSLKLISGVDFSTTDLTNQGGIINALLREGNNVNMHTYYAYDYFFPNTNHCTVNLGSGFIGFVNSDGTNKKYIGDVGIIEIGENGYDLYVSQECSIIARSTQAPAIDTIAMVNPITEGYLEFECYATTVRPFPYDYFNDEETFAKWVNKNIHTVNPIRGLNDPSGLGFYNYTNTNYWSNNEL